MRAWEFHIFVSYVPMLNILPCPLLATRVKGGSSDHQIVVIPTGTRCYNFDTVLQEKVGTIYDLMSQLRYFGKNSLETPPKLHKPFYTSTLQLPIPNVVTKTQLLSLVQ